MFAQRCRSVLSRLLPFRLATDSWIVQVLQVLRWHRLAGQRFQKLLQPLLFFSREVQWLDLLRSSEKRTDRIAAAIVEFDHIVERRGLPWTQFADCR